MCLNKILVPYHESLLKLPKGIKKQRALVWSIIENVRNNEENYQIVDDTKHIKGKLLLVDKKEFPKINNFSIYDDKIVIVGLTSEFDSELSEKTKIDVLLIVNPGTGDYGPIFGYSEIKRSVLRKVKYSKIGNKWHP